MEKLGIHNIKLSHKGLILVCIPLFFQLLFVAVLASLFHSAEQEADKAKHSKAVIAAANSLMEIYYQGGTALFGYSISHKGLAFERRYKQVAEKIPIELAAFSALVAKEPDEQEDLRRVVTLGKQTLELMSAFKSAVDQVNKSTFKLAGISVEDMNEELAPLKRQFEPMVANLVFELNKTISKHKQVEVKSEKSEKQQRLLIQQFLVAGILINLLLVPAIAILFNKVTTSRLDVLTDNARRFGKGKELNPPLEGKDEIAYVDQVFHKMASDLVELERIKQDFVNMVSHDLRSPLGSVQLFLSAVAEGMYAGKNETLMDRAQLMVTNINRLIKLINSLLDIEKMESGMMKFDRKLIALDSILKQSSEAVHDLAATQSVSLDIPVTSLEIYGDEDSLVQVLVNLLSNAIKFSPAESTVSVAAAQTAGWTEVKVVDRGRGIPPENISTIFEKFKQVSDSDGRQGRGTGLGLPICKAIVEGHSGSIGVESDGKTGSTFWFRIPEEAPVAASS